MTDLAEEVQAADITEDIIDDDPESERNTAAFWFAFTLLGLTLIALAYWCTGFA